MDSKWARFKKLSTNVSFAIRRYAKMHSYEIKLDSHNVAYDSRYPIYVGAAGDLKYRTVLREKMLEINLKINNDSYPEHLNVYVDGQIAFEYFPNERLSFNNLFKHLDEVIHKSSSEDSNIKDNSNQSLSNVFGEYWETIKAFTYMDSEGRYILKNRSYPLRNGDLFTFSFKEDLPVPICIWIAEELQNNKNAALRIYAYIDECLVNVESRIANTLLTLNILQAIKQSGYEKSINFDVKVTDLTTEQFLRLLKPIQHAKMYKLLNQE